MHSKVLDRLLFKEDPVEKLQKETGKNVNDVHIDFNSGQTPQIPSQRYFQNSNIFINKHHRYSYMPAHTHDFIELNYMYSGHCRQYINDEPVALHAGNVILMDKDIVQKIDYVGESDILINILIKDDSILANVLNTLAQSTSLVTQFLVNASKVHAIHNNYILFDAQKNEVAQHLIDSLIIRGLGNDGSNAREVNLLLSLLLNELSHSIEAETHNFESGTDDLLQILQYIDQHFQTVSLAGIGRHFGYNSNYIGNKIKAETGFSFQSLVNRKRVSLAKQLLAETDYPIARIASEVGFSNASSLSKLFSKQIGYTPGVFRQRRHVLDVPRISRTLES
ncbi:AraC family transcriptional regulator [Lacticaseibacillus sp. 53-4]|uniref:AraC family transcriptional regulator n=1 Tax=Lacticaseibacillus sp. 53-4 TaxID=2799575 RepID=UPI0019424DDA|nr:AraC family transcriptional regulator [Lacticaseibacillus sp. 53-4]